ncbi:MAG: PP2C family protein-serine/threonine phosphatase [Ilumatobacteraceae bacterium]
MAPGLFVVADGMGGHDGGDIASAMAVEVFAAAAPTVADGGLPMDAVEHLLVEANSAIRRRAGAEFRSGMGTTVIGLVVAQNGDGPSPLMFQVGDSRCYVLAAGALRQISHDHSEVQELVDSGELTPAEARTHPMRNVVTRALGAEETVSADYMVLGERDARVLLCSDGLSGELTDEQISAVLNECPEPQRAADELVRLVLTGPAKDNVTVIVVDLTVTSIADDDVTAPRETVA